MEVKRKPIQIKVLDGKYPTDCIYRVPRPVAGGMQIVTYRTGKFHLYEDPAIGYFIDLMRPLN